MADRQGSSGTVRYEPGADAASRYPDWVIRHRPLSHGIPEVLCRRRKVILIASGSSWPEKRCSLAHAVAHLDLGHHEIPGGIFDTGNEAAASHLAARRLLPKEALAEVLCWTRHRTEVAEELCVDLATLRCREKNLYGGEQLWLRRNVRWLEETA
jgi:hypothetical protein